MGFLKKLFGNEGKENAAKAEELFSQGAKLAQQQKWQDAIAKLTEAVSLNPKHAKAHMSLSIAYAAAMDFESARKHYDILNKLDPALANKLAQSPAGVMIIRSGGIMLF